MSEENNGLTNVTPHQVKLTIREKENERKEEVIKVPLHSSVKVHFHELFKLAVPATKKSRLLSQNYRFVRVACSKAGSTLVANRSQLSF